MAQTRSRTSSNGAKAKPLGRGHLDEHIPYLINHTGGRYAIELAKALRAADVKFTEWRVMHTLWHRGPLFLTDVARQANFDLSTLSRVVQGLEASGWVRRLPESNGRGKSHGIELTVRGTQLVESLVAYDQELMAKLLRGFTRDERSTLMDLLKRMYVNISDEDV